MSGSLSDLSAIPAAPGVYVIVNTTNGKQYVGSSVNMLRRLRKHVSELRHAKHWNGHLSASFMKHGESAFRAEVLALAEEEVLGAAEQFFIDRERAANPANGYNLSATVLRVTHTAETRERIAAAGRGRRLSEEHKAALRAYAATPEAKDHLARLQQERRGTTHTDVTRARLSEVNRGRAGRKLSSEERGRLAEWRRSTPFTDDHRAKLSAAKKGKPGRKLQPHEIELLRQRRLSPEHKLAISRVGKSHSEETRRRMSEAHKGKPTGRRLTPEQLAVMKAGKAAKKQQTGGPA